MLHLTVEKLLSRYRELQIGTIALVLINHNCWSELTQLVRLKLLRQFCHILLELAEEVVFQLCDHLAPQLHLILHRIRVVFYFLAEEVIALRQPRKFLLCHILSSLGYRDKVALNCGFFFCHS